MHQIATAVPHTAIALPEVADEDLATRSAARLLITAPSHQIAEALARRIHHAGVRARLPFVPVRAVALPAAPEMLRNSCRLALEAAAGGTVFISDVEELATTVQERLLDVFQELESARDSSTAVRVVSGTTASLSGRVASGGFCERLFYRLNVIHLTV